MPSPQNTTPIQGLNLLLAQDKTGDLSEGNFIRPHKIVSELIFSDQKYSKTMDFVSSDIFTEMSCTTDRAFNPQQQPDASNLSISSSSTSRHSLPSASKNTNDFMDLTQQVPNFDTEEFFNSENMLDTYRNTDVFQQTSSLSRQQINYSQQPSTENLETMPQQLILKSLANAQPKKLGKTRAPIASDDEYSTIFDQEFDDQETLISKQSPRKKRKVNKKNVDVPDSSYFTIICDNCFPKKQFKTSLEYNLIRNFKKHLKNKHPNITEQQTETYITKHLNKPDLPTKFLVRCPECECILRNIEISGLKKNLFYHVLKNKKHIDKRLSYSKASLAAHVENNCKQTPVPAQRELKNKNFTITCNHCSPKVQFKTSIKYSIIRNFKKHSKNKHPNITEQQTETYITKHLNKPNLRAKFLVNCPKSECKHIAQSVRKDKLKTRLFNHMSIQHPRNLTNYSKESVAAYVENSWEEKLVPAQKQLKPTKKRKINK